MAITGTHRYRNPRTGNTESAVVVAPVAKMFVYATRSGRDGYACLGVVGNRAHLMANTPGDHSWFSRHTTFRIVGGPTLYPRKGWIYAGDWHVPEPEKFERWLLARLRAGVYLNVVKYFNINNRHWNRKAVRRGTMFAFWSHSGDAHLHLSIMPGAEYAIVDLFGDYERFRTTGKNRPATGAAAKPATRPSSTKPAPAKARPVDVAARRLPPVRAGRSGRLVRLVQAGLVAHGLWPVTDAKAVIDGAFGPKTESRVKIFQRSKNIKVTGIVDTATWDALMPDDPPTVKRGSDGYYVRLVQCLLLAWGVDPGGVDGEAGDATVAAIQRFQIDRRVRNSVVRGRGDGIGGTATWVAFLTP